MALPPPAYSYEYTAVQDEPNQTNLNHTRMTTNRKVESIKSDIEHRLRILRWLVYFSGCTFGGLPAFDCLYVWYLLRCNSEIFVSISSCSVVPHCLYVLVSWNGRLDRHGLIWSHYEILTRGYEAQVQRDCVDEENWYKLQGAINEQILD